MGRIIGLVFEVKEVKNADVSLNKLTLEQLKSLAEEKGIEFTPKIKKDDLIILIKNEIENEEEA